MSTYLDTCTEAQMAEIMIQLEDPVVLFELNLYGHPLAGQQWERQFEKIYWNTKQTWWFALFTCPTCRITSLEPQLFRVLLLRRLHLHLPLTARFCRCGQPLDPCGHHRAALVLIGEHRSSYQAGARVTTNILGRDLDLAEPNAADGRRLEVVANGLPLFGGAQLAIDTTLVSTVHANGLRRVGVDGAALQAPRRRKERRPGWWCLPWRCVEAGPQETQSFLSSLAHAKARSETSLMRRGVEQAWRLRGAPSSLALFFCDIKTTLLTQDTAEGNPPLRSQVENNSTESGANPSCPSGVSALEETNEVAKALLQDTDNILIHLLRQKWKADPHNGGGASRARDPANDVTLGHTRPWAVRALLRVVPP